jgi:hypothetical protein
MRSTLSLHDQPFDLSAEGVVAGSDFLLRMKRFPDLIDRPTIFERADDLIALSEESGHVARAPAAAIVSDTLGYSAREIFAHQIYVITNKNK